MVIAAVVPACARREQQQRRAQALAAAGDDVIRDLANQHDVRAQALAKHAIDRGHIVADDGVQEIEGHERSARIGCCI
jgi:hypothetical protein